MSFFLGGIIFLFMTEFFQNVQSPKKLGQSKTKVIIDKKAQPLLSIT